MRTVNATLSPYLNFCPTPLQILVWIDSGVNIKRIMDQWQCLSICFGVAEEEQGGMELPGFSYSRNDDIVSSSPQMLHLKCVSNDFN